MAIESLTTPLLLAAGGDPTSHVVPHTLFEVAGFDVSNHLLMGMVAAVLVLLMVSGLAARMGGAKQSLDDYITRGALWQLLETICEFVRNNIAKPNLGHLTDKYIGYLWTVFFFILTCNLLGLVPTGPLAGLIASVAGVEHYQAWSHWGGTATGTIAMTIPLALVAFIMINFVGIREAGVEYFKHFSPGPLLMAPMLVPLEVMGLIIKSAVLAMRLFGTMMAGHLVIAAFLGLVALAGGAVSAFLIGAGVTVMGGALMLLELFVALLQAFIFTFLTTLFIAQGAVHHHHEPDDDHGPGLEAEGDAVPSSVAGTTSV